MATRTYNPDWNAWLAQNGLENPMNARNAVPSITRGLMPGNILDRRNQEIANRTFQERTAELNRMYSQDRAAFQASEAAQQADAKKRVEDARNEMYGNARGAVSRASGGDPLDQQILAAVQQRLGSEGPWTADARSAYGARIGDQAAAAEGAQLARLRRQGLAPTDPAFQAAAAEALAGRQRNVMQGQQDLSMRADVDNYAARGQNIADAARWSAQQEGRRTDAERYLNSLLMREEGNNEQPVAPGGGGQSWTTTTTGRIGGTTAPAQSRGAPQVATGWNPTPLSQRSDRSGWTPQQIAAAGGGMAAANSTRSGFNANALNGVQRTQPVGLPGSGYAMGYAMPATSPAVTQQRSAPATVPQNTPPQNITLFGQPVTGQRPNPWAGAKVSPQQFTVVRR